MERAQLLALRLCQIGARIMSPTPYITITEASFRCPSLWLTCQLLFTKLLGTTPPRFPQTVQSIDYIGAAVVPGNDV